MTSNSASGLDVSFQWSSSFNSQHAVERYRVSVDPDPSSSCSSDQVMPSEDFSCPGLSPERNYSITVSTINCGDQEGESYTFTVLPQLLGITLLQLISLQFEHRWGVPEKFMVYVCHRKQAHKKTSHSCSMHDCKDVRNGRLYIDVWLHVCT